MTDVITLTQDLIACPSITPEDAGAQTLLAKKLESLGFECHHLPFGEGKDRVPNLFARLGSEGPHICYAGHTDVVPTGPEDKWTYGPFTPHIEDGIMYGRGTSDMKGSVAAFTCAIAKYLEKNGKPKGSISLLITGDEEAVAINGTIKVLEWMKENGHVPDVALVGEPTNPDYLGQEIKIGRRGSLTGFLSVTGKQGHVAYPHRSDNPLPRLIAMLNTLANYVWDEGTEFFPPTNLELTTIDVGNKADNVIPNHGDATFNIRFNDTWTRESLKAQIKKILDKCGGSYEINFSGGARSFVTQPCDWTDVVAGAVEDIVGKKPALTTSGGTSDARFVVEYCPVVEFGGINKSIHQINENASVADLENIGRIYERVLERYFS